jgi:hypothetical protein
MDQCPGQRESHDSSLRQSGKFASGINCRTETQPEIR